MQLRKIRAKRTEAIINIPMDILRYVGAVDENGEVEEKQAAISYDMVDGSIRIDIDPEFPGESEKMVATDGGEKASQEGS